MLPNRHIAAAFAICLPFLDGEAHAFIEVPGVGLEGNGADIAVTNLDPDPRPDIILMAYDASGETNNFRYRVGWNLGPDGSAARWDSNFIAVDGAGHRGEGAGAAVTNLDGDSRPELILMAYGAASGQNNFRYKIGWNLDSSGRAQRWDTGFIVVDGIGHLGQGADVLVTNLDNNPRPEMILMAYDAPSGPNNFRYKIGWNLDATGRAQRWDTDFMLVGGLGEPGQGAGAAIINLDNDPRPEMILMAYAAPAGPNNFRFTVGWNLDSTGRAQRWDRAIAGIDGFGREGQGAGLAAVNLDADPRPELMVMAYDNPAGANTFRYDIMRNIGKLQAIHLEMDKLSTVNWPPDSVTWAGATHSLESIYVPLGIAVTPQQDQGTITDLRAGACYSDADLDSLQSTNMNRPPSDSNSWHVYAVFVTCYANGDDVKGFMFDADERRGFAVFLNPFSSVPATEREQRILRTTAHELGHALCLFHEDGDAWRASGPVEGTGRTVMDQNKMLASDWGYAWNAPVVHRIYDYPKSFWRPGNGIAFTACQP